MHNGMRGTCIGVFFNPQASAEVHQTNCPGYQMLPVRGAPHSHPHHTHSCGYRKRVTFQKCMSPFLKQNGKNWTVTEQNEGVKKEKVQCACILKV